MGTDPAELSVQRERRRGLIEHLRERGIQDLAVLHAFDRVHRHLFVPDLFVAKAYEDQALPLGHGQTISRPSTHALCLAALGLRGDERVLEIGTGSGFQTALLATLCRQVFSIERVPELALAARDRIEKLGFTNILIRAGDGSFGWRTYAPYDVIVVAAGAAEVPQPLLEQLADGGRLLIPIGEARSQRLHKITRIGHDELEDQVLADVSFVELRGSPPTRDPKGGRTSG